MNDNIEMLLTNFPKNNIHTSIGIYYIRIRVNIYPRVYLQIREYLYIHKKFCGI